LKLSPLFQIKIIWLWLKHKNLRHGDGFFGMEQKLFKKFEFINK
jgi:hypothetical protein